MRFFTGLGLLIVAAFVPEASNAAGNVLLPESSSGSSSSFPSLGLVPRLLTPSKPKQNTIPESSTTPAAVSTATPPPAKPAAAIPQPVINNASVSPRPSRDFKPTVVAHMARPDAPARGSRIFTIALSDRSMFSTKDIANINKTLGITPDQVVKTCSLSLRGTLRTTMGNYFVDGGTNPQAQVGYGGVIVDPYVRAVAVCPANHALPQGVGVVMESGGAFIVQLENINCSASIPPNATMLLAKYTGDKTTECLVQ